MFRRRAISLTVALGLHGVGGWLLSAAAPDVSARAAEPEPALVWLEAPAIEGWAAGDGAAPPQPGSAPPQPAPARGAPAERTARSRTAAAPSPPRASDPRPPRPAPSRPEAASEREAEPREPAPEPVTPERFARADVGAAFSTDAASSRAADSGPLARGVAGSYGTSGPGRHWGRGVQADARHSASPAHLVGHGSSCADLFPHSANSDRGVVEVALRVAVSGQPLDSQIVDEVPRDQGFALAARHCVRRLRFTPALDGSGHAVASRSVVRLRFERHSPTASRAL